MEYYLTVTKDKVWIHAVTWMKWKSLVTLEGTKDPIGLE